MADELDPVEQTFTADTAEYEEWLESAAMSAQEFADANDEAKAAVDGLRDSTAEAGAAADGAADEWLESAQAAAELRDNAAEAGAALDGLDVESAAADAALAELRDQAMEAALALGLYQDKLGRWHEASGQFVAAAEVEARGLAHLRDAAAEAAAAMGLAKDEEGRWVDEAGEVVAAAEVEAAALGHVRDNAAEAAVAVRELKKEGEGEAASGFLMWLNGGKGSGGPLGGALEMLPDFLPLLIAIVPAIEAVLVLVAGLASGFVAAGIGVGAFAALAIPAVTAITGALGDTKAQLEKLPQPIQTAVSELKSVEAQYKSMAKAFQPEVVGLFSQALGIVSDHMSILLPLAQAATPAISGVLGMLNNGLNGDGFKKFIDYMKALEGPSITAIGSGLGRVAGSLERFLTVMSAKDVVHAINTAFDILSGTINVLTYMVHRLMTNWDEISDSFRRVRHDVAGDAHELAHVFDDLRHDIANDAHNIASYFDEARANIHDWADGARDDFDDVRHDAATLGDDIARPFEQAIDEIKSHSNDILSWLIDPVGAAVFVIRTHTHEIAQDFDTMRHDVASTLDGWRHDIANDFDDAMADVDRFTTWLPHAIGDAFSSSRRSSDASSDGMRHDLANVFDGMRHDIAGWADDVGHYIGVAVSWFDSLPHRAVDALAALPGELYAAGAQAIRSLIAGAGSMIGSGLSDLENWGHDLANAIVHPFGMHLSEPSEAAIMIKAGINATRGLAAGMLSEVGAVRQASEAIKSAAGLSGGTYGTAALGGLGAPGAATGASHATVNITANLGAGMAAYNTPAFYQYLQREIQEAVARFSLNNPGTGFGLPGRA